MKDLISYSVFQEKTAFMPLRYIYPECWVLIEDHPQIRPLLCMKEDGCPVNANCGEKISKRVHYLFDEVLFDAEMLIGYYKYRDSASVRGVYFYRDMSEPQLRTLNPFALKKFLKEGTTYQWLPTDEYMLIGGSKNQLPVIL